MNLKPLFMWTGGKGKVIPKYKLLDVLPSYKQFDSYRCEVPVFREILPYQSIRVLVRATLP
jgi:hypothetical protein